VQEIRERVIEDIPVPKTVVTKYRIERRYCKSCKIMVESPVDDALPNARLSIRAMLVVAYLKIGMGMSGENVSDAMMNLFGVAISEGEVDNILKLLAEAFGDKYVDLLQAIRDATYRHMDSTSWRNDGKNENLWTFVTRGEAVFRISRSNGHDVPLEVLGEHGGTDIHDRHSAFETLASKTGNDQQYCWSHIICDAKELKKFHGNDGNRILRSLKRVYREAKAFKGHGTVDDVEKLHHRLVFLIDSDYDHRDCRSFVDNLLKRKKEWLFKFVTDPDVEPTNNRAERALRPSVMYRKRNGGTRSESGDRVYERIYSLHYTSKLKKSSILTDGPSEIKKWMDRNRRKKMEERLNRSGKTTGPAS
jgi:transposase